MAKPKKGLSSQLNLNSAVDSAFAKMSRKEQGKAIGSNPDEIDEKWINIWVDMYNKAYPGRLKKMARDVRNEIIASDITKHAELSKDSALRKGFWLPQDLCDVLEKAYPSFWTNQQHADWFCRKFPIFSYQTYTKALKR